MNRIYRNVWNAITGTWVAVAETAKGKSKGTSGSRACVEATDERPATRSATALRYIALLACVSIPMLTFSPVYAVVCDNSNSSYSYSGNATLNGPNLSLKKGDTCTVNVTNNATLNVNGGQISNNYGSDSQGQVIHGQGTSTINITGATLTSNPGNIGLGLDGSGTSTPTANITGTTINQMNGGQALHARSATITSSKNTLNLTNAIGIRAFNDTSANSATGTVNSTSDTFKLTGTPGAHGTDPSNNDSNAGALALKAHGGGAIALSKGTITGSGDGMYAVNSGSKIIDGSDKTGNTVTLDNTATGGGYGLYSSDSGSINLTNTSVAMKGKGSIGASADTQGQITLNGSSSVATQGDAAHALYANGTGSKITVNGSGRNVVSTTGAGAYGAYAANSGQVQLSGDAVSTTGANASGAYATTNGQVQLTGGAISTSGAGANGAYATTNGQVQLTSDTVSTSGAGANGAYATSGGQVQLSGDTVSTSGASAQGVKADAGSTVSVAGGSISTSGTSSDAVYTSGTNALVDLSDASATQISTTQDNAYGVYASSGGQARLNNDSIVTAGAAAHGIVIDGTGSVQTAGTNTITTNGAQAHGVRVQNGGSMTFGGTSGNSFPAVTVNGDGSAVLNASGARSTLNMTGNTALNTDMTPNANSYGALAENQGAIGFSGSASTGGTRIEGNNGTLAFAGQSDAAGSRVGLDNGGMLDLSGMTAGTALHTGSLEGTADSSVTLGANHLVTGIDNAAQNGTLLADTTYDGTITGSGSLEVAANKLTLTNANTYSGGTQIDEGNADLAITNGKALGSGDVLDNGTLELNYSGAGATTTGAYDATFANNLSGTGTTLVNGHDINVTGGNSGFSGQWQIGENNSMQVTQQENLGTAAANVDGILNVAPATGGFTMDNALTGSGTVQAKMGTAADAFAFGKDTGDQFAGTLEMGQGTLQLDGDNTKALTNATLDMQQDSTTTVGDGDQKIGGLKFSGGSAVFNATLPDQTVATSTITTNALDVSGTGTVQINVPKPYDAVTPDVSDSTRVPLLEQDDGDIGVKLVNAATTTGTAGQLVLADQNGAPIGDGTVVDIAQNGQKVAEGTYNYRLTTAPGDGLYVNYGLSQVDLQQDQTLALQQREGAQGAAADLSAKVTGTGNLAIDAGDGAVSLSNAGNDYQGATTVQSGTLQMADDNVLGQTSALNLNDSTATKMGGHSQTIGELHAAEGSTLDLQDGTLTIANGGNADGVLQGGGQLNVNGGTLAISPANNGLSANTAIADGAEVSMKDVAGLGSGAIADSGTLTFDGASGSFANSVSGDGAVHLANNANVEAAGDNSDFGGRFGIDEGATLSATQAQNLGTASIADAGTLRIDNDNDWTLNNAIDGTGSLVKDGNGTLNIGDSVLHTGTTAINAGTMIVGDDTNPARTLGGAEAGEVTVASGANLAGQGTVSGHVTNYGEVAALNTLPAYENVAPGSFTMGGGLTNAGVVNLAGPANSTPGNTLVVNGDYIGQGGKVAIRTFMGDDTSATDKLMINGGNASGDTGLVVKSAGGNGAQTDRGIRVVETLNGATTALGAFALDPASEGYRQGAGSLAVGPYDYRLARGGNGGVANDWYLVSGTQPVTPPDQPVTPVTPVTPDQPVTPVTPVTPDQPNTPDQPVAPPQDNSGTRPDAPATFDQPTQQAVSPVYRPEVGAYMNNKLAATSMSIHTLRDREGQAPGSVDYDPDGAPDRGAWARVAGSTSSRNGAGGLSDHDTSYLVHAGSDILRFSDGGDGSIRLGVMGAYGSSDNSSSNGSLTARGTVSGYNAGIYGTWYGDKAILTGPYVDSWLMFGGYNNQVKGDGLAAESYGSHTLTGSVEGGYAFKLLDRGDRQFYIVPMAQLVLQNYSAGSHTEQTGTIVTDQSQTGLTTRLGVRGYANLLGSDGKSATRPYAELNWWHGPSSQEMQFNNVHVSEGLPANRYEAKVGVQSNVSKNTTVWGDVGVDAGSQNYRAGKAQVGIKHTW